MSIEELFKLFEKQRENVKKEKGKLITIPVEQLDQMEKEYRNCQLRLRFCREQKDELEKKFKEQVSKTKSWSAKYNYQIRKSKNEIYEELEKEQQAELEKHARNRLNWKEHELEQKYLMKEIQLKSQIKEGIKEVIEDFANRLSEEKNRYEEKHDLDNERNQGYLIGIAKTRKELLKAFEEYEKKV